MKPRILVTGGTGYIGSRLRQYLHDGDSVDLERFGHAGGFTNSLRSYQSLSREELNAYDVIVHLAGHSSVAMCNNDKEGAVTNNITGFAELLRLCAGKRLIYASSSSVYNGCGAELATEAWTGFRPTNRYDVSKYTMDLLAMTSEVDFYGLRFGSVCGWSPNLRNDLMINRMVQDARSTGRVNITNPQVHRPILAIDDLCRAVQTLVSTDTKPGIYNLASFNATVGEVGGRVASICGADTNLCEGTTTYDFSVSSEAFSRAFGFDFCGDVDSIVLTLLSRPPILSGGRS